MNSLRIAPLTRSAEFERCVALQQAVWQYDIADLIPRRVFLLAERIGGQVFGAFDDALPAGPDAIVAFAMSLPGIRDGRPYLHSHMLAVLPEYRNRGLGRLLKLAQRDEALSRGIELIEWTFDPLEIKNAYLNIARLGAICRRYAPDFYGPSSSPLQGGLPTDRLYAEWWLRSSRVQRMLEGNIQNDDPATPERPPVLIAVPHDIQQWKQDPVRAADARALQQRNREALQAAFAHGLAITGYRRSTHGDGTFLLTPASPNPSQHP